MLPRHRPPPTQALYKARSRDTRAVLRHLQQPTKVLVRLSNHPAAHRAISSIRADAIGRLVSVRGTVVRATAPQPLVTTMEFVCGKCGAPRRAAFPEGRFTPPAACGEGGCRSRTFTPILSSATCVDWQRVLLQVGWAGGRGRAGCCWVDACRAAVHAALASDL